MIPYLQHPILHIGPLTIHAFGVLVAVSMWFGLWAIERRLAMVKLDPSLGAPLGGWMIAAGLVGAHLFAVLLYFPQRIVEDGWILLRMWDPISSFGGMLGGVLGALIFFSTRKAALDAPTRLAYVDAVASVFPPCLAIGRLGCALAHDHPGTVTNFPLAVSLSSNEAIRKISEVYQNAGLTLPQITESSGFHDLGLYEFLYLALVVTPIFYILGKKPRKAGFFLMMFGALYLPVRFGFDMLRVSDVRYVGLTPAQWAAALLLFALSFVAVRRLSFRLALAGTVVLVTAWACTGGSVGG